jgi:hypothetical protein
LHRQRNIGASEIDHGTTSNCGSILGLFEHQSHSGAIEESQIAEAIKLSQPEPLLIKGLGPIDVADRERNLPDLTEIQEHLVSR